MLRKKATEGHPSAGSNDPGSLGADELNYMELGLSKIPMFSACTPDELMHVAQLTEIREAPAGTVLVNEGDAGNEFFVILRGEASVTRAGDELARLGAGEFFGELALFDPAPRNATVTAASLVSVAVLTKPRFHEALDEKTFRENVFLGMARRLHELDAST